MCRPHSSHARMPKKAQHAHYQARYTGRVCWTLCVRTMAIQRSMSVYCASTSAGSSNRAPRARGAIVFPAYASNSPPVHPTRKNHSTSVSDAAVPSFSRKVLGAADPEPFHLPHGPSSAFGHYGFELGVGPPNPTNRPQLERGDLPARKAGRASATQECCVLPEGRTSD